MSGSGMPSAKEMARHIGRRGRVEIAVGGGDGALHVPIEVTDARHHFGRLNLCITPVGGAGEAWVSEARVTFDDEPEGPSEEATHA